MAFQLIKYVFCFLLAFNPNQGNRDIADYDKKILALDKTALKSEKKVIKVPSWVKKGKYISLTLYYKGSVPIKLEYPTLEESGSFVSKDYIYFDEHGKMYCGVMTLGDN